MSTKYKLRITGECKQNMKLCKRRGLPMDELWTVVGKLLNGEQLEEKYQAHVLTGDRKGQWECHIQPNWLLIWEIRNQELVLVLLNTGTLRPFQQEVQEVTIGHSSTPRLHTQGFTSEQCVSTGGPSHRGTGVV